MYLRNIIANLAYSILILMIISGVEQQILRTDKMFNYILKT